MKLFRFLPYLLGGAVVGLLLIFVLVGQEDGPLPKPSFELFAEIDSTPSPMVDIPAGEFVMGSQVGPPDGRPEHRVTLSAFRLEVTEVTNARFAAFVKATGYVTVAERQPDLTQFPGAKAGSAVFRPVHASTDERTWPKAHPPWWVYIPGANWKHPHGPDSNLNGKMNHPVVHISWEDAAQYAKWTGRRLPTEAEWEYAARGGLDRQEFCWGNAKPGEGGRWYANTFQGEFPHGDNAEDGFRGLAPVKSFPPNGFGLHDMSGNVWEWCADWYDSTYYANSPRQNPSGPTMGEPIHGQPQRVRRGGSFLCTDDYCWRYRPAARDKNPEDSGASHTGFRCAE